MQSEGSVQEVAAERRQRAGGSCGFEKVAAGATALGGAACKRQLRGLAARAPAGELADDGGGRAVGGSSGATKEMRWRAAEQKSCGEGQQSGRAVVKGSRAEEEQR